VSPSCTVRVCEEEGVPVEDGDDGAVAFEDGKGAAEGRREDSGVKDGSVVAVERVVGGR
jgi:hypothetical protein